MRPQSEGVMELVFTTIAVIGGMTFSLAIAILVEELIFGKVICVFFAPRATQAKAAAQHQS
jgi:ABC-type sugar transport system permease subunit